MAVEIAGIEGLIELKDDFTGQLNVAEAALQHFSAENQESLKAVAGAAGLITAALGATAAAVVALGSHGADVADVDSTLEHFAGSAKDAAAIMQALKDGTKGTVDNFTLAKDAAHLLSAGVKLTTEDFGTLSQAAFVLQNRGLGGTKEQLELVSDALVTGRTKALSMALGVIDAGDAEENYAKQLGITKDQLTDTEKVEAKRVEVMRILNSAVKDAGDQQRDFGEELEAVKATVTNWGDSLAKAIAQSPVLAAGLHAIEQAVEGAFGDDQSKGIDTVVHGIEQAAIVSIDFAQGAITMARVVEGAWYTIKAAVLAVETAVTGVIDGLYEAATVATAAAEKVHLVPQGATKEITETRDQLRAMTADLAAQTAEAANSFTAHTKLDDTLDALSGSLTDVQKQMIAASGATHEVSEADDIAAHNAKVLADAEKELNAVHGDQTKILEQLTKSTKELNKIWDDYFTELAKGSETSGEAQREQIEQTFNKQVEELDALDPLFKEKYNALRAVADEKLSQIGSDWQNLTKQSKEALQEQADAALEDYNRMAYGSLTFSREALDTQLQKWRDLQDAVNQYGKDAVAAQDEALKAAEAHTAELDKQAADLQRIKNLAGGSAEVTSVNFEQQVQEFNKLQQFVGAASIDYGRALELAKKGYSFQDIVNILTGKIQNPGPPAGPKIPGFAEGGTVMVGENGPEIVRLPLGSTVFPNGSRGIGGGAGQSINIQNTFHVNGTAADVAKKVGDHIMGQLKLHRQFGSA